MNDKPLFPQLQKKEPFAEAVARVAFERPFGAFIAVSFIFGGGGLFVGWIADHYATRPWIRSHQHGLALLKNGLLLLGFPGIVIERCYAPGATKTRISDAAMKICLGIALAGAVVVAAPFVFDR